MTIVTEGSGRRLPFPFELWSVLFLVAVTGMFWLSYSTYPVSPAMDPPDGDWFGWWDQSQYLKSAVALAHGDLSPESHWYPLGYSLLAVPFVDLLPRHPFLIVNLVATLVFAGAFLIYFRPVIGYWATVAAFAAGLMIPPVLWLPWKVDFPFWLQFVIPWNSVPVAAAFMVIIVLMRSLRSKPSVWTDFAIGALAGLVAVTRPIDVIPLVPIAIIYLWQRLTPAVRWRNIAVGLGGMLVLVVPVVVLLLAIHGGFASRYGEVSARIGLSVAGIPYKAFIVLLNAQSAGGPLSLFQVNPLFYLAIPLAVAWAIPDRRNGLVPVVMSVAAIATYLAYNDFLPLNMFLFFLVHYIAWAFPVLVAAGIAGMLVLLRQKRYVALVVAAVVLPLLLASLRLQEDALPAEVESRVEDGGVRYIITLPRQRTVDAIDFRGISSIQHPTQVPHYDEDVRADDQPLAKYKGYRAVALRRGTRLLLTGSAHARTFEIFLDDTFQENAGMTAEIRPLAFRLRLTWPWNTIGNVRWTRVK